VSTDGLNSPGFVVNGVAKGLNWIIFSRTVGNVERAFHTKIRNYRVDGRLRRANSQDHANTIRIHEKEIP
jgi:subtilase family serine protease